MYQNVTHIKKSDKFSLIKSLNILKSYKDKQKPFQFKNPSQAAWY